MRKIVLRLAGLFFLGLGLTQGANAATCTAADLQGDYAFELSGTIVTDSGLQAHEIQWVGVLNFDGVDTGRLLRSIRQTNNFFSGDQVKVRGSGKFSIKPNCMASWILKIAGTAEKIIVNIASINEGTLFLMTRSQTETELTTMIGQAALDFDFSF